VTGVSPAVGVRWFREGGGMSTVSAARLSERYRSFGEREEIALLQAQDCGVRAIARRVGRCPSTISRELRRNAATRSGAFSYRATTAQWHADRRARRPKGAKLAANEALRDYVQARLAGTLQAADGTDVPGPTTRWQGRRHGRRQDRRWATAWSPEQISNRLPIDFPGDASMRISPEAIYQALYVQGRGALRREYFPKGTDLCRHRADDLTVVATALNRRPRKALGWQTPAEAFQEHIRSLQEATVATTN
jgi:IS30 family transposase